MPKVYLLFVVGWLALLATAKAQNGLVRDFYTNINTGTLTGLTNNANFPNSPTSSTLLDEFEAPQNAGDRYGQRIRGYLVPPVTGNYTFWIAADQQAALFISSDESPLNKLLIASVNSPVPYHNFQTDTAQKSAAIALIAGKRYYIEAVMVELTGDDHLTVRWQLPDKTIEEPIPNSRVFAEITPPQIVQQPVGLKVNEGESATFTVRVSNLSAVNYQWTRGGVPIPGATNNTYSIAATSLVDDGARFRVLISNLFGTSLSDDGVLTVERDINAPTVLSVVNSGESDIVTVSFSKRVSAVTATNVANYTIQPNIQVLNATLTPDGTTVVLKTSPLAFRGTYTISFSGISDEASVPNFIDPATQSSFTYNFNPLDPSLVYGKPEVLGPSSRRTPLVISEIMYHPAARTDAKITEFIEIYNSALTVENLGGFTVKGAIDYTLPIGTFIPARGFLVIAPVPSDIQTIYGLAKVYGGFTNRLGNGGGIIRLLDNLGTVLLETTFADTIDWPAAADGTGHSLVLARPSYGENDRRAWAPSQQVGGSPGRAETVSATVPFQSLVINEVAPDAGFVELYNYSAQVLNVGGCFLSDDPSTNKFKIAANTTIPAFTTLGFTSAQLGFTPSPEGGTIYLWNSQRTRVIDAVRYLPQPAGLPVGRFPDGNPLVSTLSAPTFNGSNAARWRSDLVINEIMYNPISHQDSDEYVEIYNRGTAEANLAGWRFTGGITFRFPAVKLAAGGFLVIAKDSAHLRGNYTNLNQANLLGDYQGTLANRGEKLVLSGPVMIKGESTFYVADEVDYRDGGRWGKWSDGGGSSLELIEATSDNNFASRWADSDETRKSSWTTIESTGSLDNANTNYPPSNLHILLEGAGEALLDNVSVTSKSRPTFNYVANSTFENGLNNWLAQGTHEDTTLENTEGFDSKQSLHVRATARGDTAANRIRGRLTSAVSTNEDATLRVQARWLAGNPDILLRLHGNWLESAGRLSVPVNLGTPGLPNSRRVNNAGPAIEGVSQNPIIPAANEAVTVFCRITDSDRLGFARLAYRVDPATNYTNITMTYSGAGYYSAMIPGQAAGRIASFYIEATDIRGASMRFPASAPVRTAVVVFGDTQIQGPIATYHIWMSQTNVSNWTARPSSSNKGLDSTFVYNNERVFYNVDAQYSGSPFHWQSYNGPLGRGCNYLLQFPTDDRFLGSRDFVLNLPSNADANGGSDTTAIREQLFYWIVKEVGLPYSNRRYHYLFFNGQRRQTIFEDAQQPNGEVVEEFFPNDPNGDLYKIEDWFEFNDSFAFRNIDATLEDWRDRYGNRKLARYRWNFRKRAVEKDAHDYSTLFALSDAFNDRNPDTYVSHIESLVNTDEWLGIQAMRHMAGDWDSYGYSRGKNMYAYKPENGKWELLNWDIAFSFGLGDGPTTDLFSATHSDGTVDRVSERMYNTPAFRRIYLRTLQKAATGPMIASRVEPVIDAKYRALVDAGVPVASPQAIKDYIAQRRNFILGQIAPLATTFAITSNNGGNFATNRNQVTLSGSAPLSVRYIAINGTLYPATWSTLTTWSVRYALQGPVNNLVVQGIDEAGQLVPDGTRQLTVNYTGANEKAEDRVMINEIHYHAAQPGTEFIELYNTSKTYAFDLSNFRLNGVSFTFPGGSIIQPDGYMIVAANQEAFEDIYGRSPALAGTYDGNLDKGGEILSLLRPGTTNEIIIDSVGFDDLAPWPLDADGTGLSLQVVDATRDTTRVANWGSGPPSPGAPNSVRTGLAAFPNVWVNEVEPNNISGVSTQAGARSPWVEIYNSGTTTVDLSSLYLTDDYTNLTKWAFPAGTTLAGKRFLIVWLDGGVSGSELHANFQSNPMAGSVALAGTVNGRVAVLDYLNHENVGMDRSFGAFPDGQGLRRSVFTTPTPGAVNNNAGPIVQLSINEWMAANNGTIANPLNGNFDDWIELYNAGTSVVDLAGFGLGEDAVSKPAFTFPAGASIPPKGYLLVWADGQKSTNATAGQYHADFKLSADGETIVLFSPGGQILDSVMFGAQSADISQGRSPDGGSGAFQFFIKPTPGTSNAGSDPNALRLQVSAAAGNLTFAWNSQAGATYQVQFKNNLQDANWSVLKEVVGTGASLSAADNISTSHRFYRLMKQ